MKQERVKIVDLVPLITQKLHGWATTRPQSACL